MASPDEWRRPGPTRRQRRIDLPLGLAAAYVALLNVAMARSLGQFVFDTVPDAAEQYVWALAGTLPLIWRRSHPEPVLLFVAVAFIAGVTRGALETEIASAALLAAMYTAGAWGRDRGRARRLRLSVIGALVVWLGAVWSLSLDELRVTVTPHAAGPVTPLVATLVNSVLITVLVLGFAYRFGETAWLAARRLHLLESQAEQLRAARAMAEERAVLAERVRIARELHDVVAHHVSVMGIQASAARRALDKDTGKARAALAAIEQGARTAVEELRRMLGALRSCDDDTATAASTGIDGLEELVARVREAGLSVRYARCGDPVVVPNSVSQAAYRIVQEAVTNTLKHARAAGVDIRVRHLPGELEVEVTDDGIAGGPPSGGGMGIIGMRERAAVHDASVEAGPVAGGGFRVRARFPLKSEAVIRP